MEDLMCWCVSPSCEERKQGGEHRISNAIHLCSQLYLIGKLCYYMTIEGYKWLYYYMWVSLVAQTVKRLSAMQETRVWSLGWEDPLKKEMQPTPVFLPGKSHGQRSLIGYRPWGCKESDTTSLSLSLYLLYRDWLFITVLQTVPTYWLETANINYLLYLQITNLKAV